MADKISQMQLNILDAPCISNFPMKNMNWFSKFSIIYYMLYF